MVYFLIANRKEGCTGKALDWSSHGGYDKINHTLGESARLRVRGELGLLSSLLVLMSLDMVILVLLLVVLDPSLVMLRYWWHWVLLSSQCAGFLPSRWSVGERKLMGRERVFVFSH